MRLRTQRYATSTLLAAPADPGRRSPLPTSTLRRRARTPRPRSGRQLRPRLSERPSGNCDPHRAGLKVAGFALAYPCVRRKQERPLSTSHGRCKTFEKCNCNHFQRYTLDPAAQGEMALDAPSAAGREDDQLLCRPGHGDVLVDGPFYAGSEGLGIDEDDEVELHSLRQLGRQRADARHRLRHRVAVADDAGDTFSVRGQPALENGVEI